MEQRNSCLFLLIIYFALAIYLLPTFSQTSPELTNWATAASLVEKNSFDISWTNDLIGENAETVKIGERSYSQTPPGISLSAAPFYAMTRLFLGEPNAENLRVSLFVMRFFISTLPLFFLAVWLFQKDVDALSLAALLFATPLFVFSFALLPDVLTAVLVYLIFRLLYDARNVFLRNNIWAGILSGFLLTCNFSAIIPISVFGFGLFFTEQRDRYRRLFLFTSGAFPFLVLLLFYNYAIFGSPFRFFYGSENLAQAINNFSYPTFSNLYFLLFSPSQGLFFYTPILFFSVIVFFISRESGTLRKRIKITTILLSVLLSACFTSIDSSWIFGAKHLSFILPLMLDSFFDGEIEDFPSLWRGFLFAVSFLFCTLPVLTIPFVSPEFSFLHNTFWRPLLFNSEFFSPTFVSFFNSTKTFWTIFPAILLLPMAIFFVWRNSKYPALFLAGIFSAVLAVGIYIFIPGLENPQNPQNRQSVIEKIKK